MGWMESTRIIPFSGTRQAAGAQPSNGGRTDPNLITMELSEGRESVSGGDAESSQRFAGEVKYVGYYAAKLASTLGMRSLELAIVEDREGQTAISAGRQDGNWHGVVSSNRRSIKQVRESLSR